MGLTVSFRLRLRAQDTPTGLVDAEALVRRARSYALRLKRAGRVDGVGPIRSDHQSLDTYYAWNRRMDPYERRWRFRPEQPVRGWGCASIPFPAGGMWDAENWPG